VRINHATLTSIISFITAHLTLFGVAGIFIFSLVVLKPLIEKFDQKYASGFLTTQQQLQVMQSQISNFSKPILVNPTAVTVAVPADILKEIKDLKAEVLSQSTIISELKAVVHNGGTITVDAKGCPKTFHSEDFRLTADVDLQKLAMDYKLHQTFETSLTVGRKKGYADTYAVKMWETKNYMVGNTPVVEKVAELQIDKFDTLYSEEQSKMGLHFSPSLLLSADYLSGESGLIGGVGVSAFTLSNGERPQDYVADFGRVSYSRKDSKNLFILSPVGLNMGRYIPFIHQFYLSPSYELTNKAYGIGAYIKF